MRSLLGLLCLTACSSGLRYSVDDDALANVSAQERKPVLEAQDDIKKARAEQQFAEADGKQIDASASAAEKEQQQAELDCETTAQAQRQAELSHDIRNMNRANRAKEAALAKRKACQVKLDWMHKRQKAARLVKLAADKHVVAAQARYEVEKARLAQQKGIKSGDIDVPRFEAQNQEAQNEWQSARNDADRALSEANDLEKEWKNADQHWLDIKGGG